MKIEIIKERLGNVLSKAQRLTGKHLSLPVLSHVLLIAKKGLLIVRATNLDMGIEITVPARVEREGEVAVSAGVFSSFISSLGNVKSVSLELVDNRLSVTAPSSKAAFNTLSGDDFTTIPRADGIPFGIDPHSLVKGFRSVHYAGALGNLKPELGSVHLYQDSGNLIFVATDSF